MACLVAAAVESDVPKGSVRQITAGNVPGGTADEGSAVVAVTR